MSSLVEEMASDLSDRVSLLALADHFEEVENPERATAYRALARLTRSRRWLRALLMTHSSALQVVGEIRQKKGKSYRHFIATAKVGWLTDGDFFVRVTPEEWEALSGWKSGNARPLYQAGRVDQQSIDEYEKLRLLSCEHKSHALREAGWHMVFQEDKVPSFSYELKVETYGLVIRRYPDAEWYGRGPGPVLVVRDGEVVAFVMQAGPVLQHYLDVGRRSPL